MFWRMAWGVIFVVSSGLVAGAVAASDDKAAQAELKKLEGTWQLLSAKQDGVATPDETVRKIQVVIQDGKHTVFFEGQAAVKDIRFSCNPSTNPKSTIDTLPDGRTILGIYRLEDDILTSCVAEPGKPRPAEFVAKEGTGHTLRVFKRVVTVAAVEMLAGGNSPRAGDNGEASKPGAEKAVVASLDWLARHQNADGSWSLDHSRRCQAHGRCPGPGDASSDTAATALALLPFLAADYSHEKKSPHQAAITKGLNWLLAHQKPNGDVSAGSSQMYAHGLATIALCEAYGKTGDARIGFAAQAALNFVASGQNAEGGWRYTHGSADSDMSVTWWQASALQAGKLAGLQVHDRSFDRVRNYLDISLTGPNQDRFGYTPKAGPTPARTAAGLLVSQFTGVAADAPRMMGGAKYLADHFPGPDRRNCYYMYPATQVLHRQGGEPWEKWNRAVRAMLIESQEKEACAAGSWHPEKPTGDAWGKHGGRLMITSLSCLTLQIPDRHLRIFDPAAKVGGKKQAEPKVPR